MKLDRICSEKLFISIYLHCIMRAVLPFLLLTVLQKQIASTALYLYYLFWPWVEFVQAIWR